MARWQHQHQLMLIGAGAVGAGGMLGSGHINAAAAGLHMASVPGLGGELCVIAC